MNKSKLKSGFTLIEVVVAAAVFAFFLGSVISVFLADTHNGPINQHRLQAANLAREGIQAVTQIRDTAVGQGARWTDFRESFGPIVCNQVLPDGITSGLRLCDNGWSLMKSVDPPVPLPPNTTTLNTITFIRTITIIDKTLFPPASSNAKLVTVTVSWLDTGGSQKIVMKKLLTDWKQ